MGGEISVHSAAGEGSTFTVRLPFNLLPEGSESPAEPTLIAGLSCVVVGNTEGLADAFAAYLTHAGATVRRAEDLMDARRHADNCPPGLSVWVIDSGDERRSAEALLAAVRVRPEAHSHFVVVVVERGQRRTPATRYRGCDRSGWQRSAAKDASHRGSGGGWPSVPGRGAR